MPSTSTEIRTIALVGLGGIGTHILRALLAVPSPTNPKVVILTRPESSKPLPQDLSASSSLQIIHVDYNNVQALIDVFKTNYVDIVLSTLARGGLKAQFTLADAAKASGTVQLFVPSEWGSATEGAKERGEKSLFGAKDEFAEYLKSIQLPYTRIYTGFFLSNLPRIVGIDVNDCVNLIGKGETPFSTTSQADIGGFTAHVLTTLPLSSPLLVNQSLRIEGDRLTFLDLARIFDKPIVSLPKGELVPGKNEDERHFRTFLQSEAEEGGASLGWNRLAGREEEGLARNANGLWEGHVWEKVQKNED
ncbi:hypothetical protein GYMLUDRAFT_206986 [Collybiopsis luxurians FD-317 M1]|uniref:NmrA-like domain-containing protein n=1 Tax=Collybiopsis luxurians FD-317 M1 TaxID=944289 RepID=A0A0D0CGE1_9AGAR|nr:hypothetical protein GYMLUDRAFT_206986 [Collybiopsis luxurians FD-317 M1]